MKKVFVFLSSVLILSCSQNTQDSCKWDYPVKPGMEEWGQFQSHDEMITACNIPKKTLTCLSTERLTNLCLQYPLLHNIYAFNFLDMGLDQLFINFNGIRELYDRQEVAEYLIKRYMEKIENLSLLEDEEVLSLEKGNFGISIWDLDALFSRVERKEDLKDVLQSLVVGYEAISKLSIDKRSLLEHNYFARAHVIIKMCEQCLDGDHLFTSFGPAPEYFDIINSLSYQLIK